MKRPVLFLAGFWAVPVAGIYALSIGRVDGFFVLMCAVSVAIFMYLHASYIPPTGPTERPTPPAYEPREGDRVYVRRAAEVFSVVLVRADGTVMLKKVNTNQDAYCTVPAAWVRPVVRGSFR